MRFLEDNYRLLGLHPGAGPARVRRAFRKAAGKCHPDLALVSGSDEFIRLRKAFKLAMGYEEGRSGNPHQENQNRGSGEGGNKDDCLGCRKPGTKDRDIVLTLDLNQDEACQGLETVLSFQRRVPCLECLAGCPGCRGRGWVLVQKKGPAEQELVRERCPLCRGLTPLSCPACGGKSYLETEAKAHILIPMDVAHGQILVMPGMGHRTSAGAGDLVLSVLLD